jgi:undecaprenyl diphosphate synthase
VDGPQHIAIVMDGNGRWAKKRLLPRNMGHKQGVEALRRTVEGCIAFKVKYLSVYVFSTENWKRPAEEVGFLMALLKDLIKKEVQKLHKQAVKVRFLGDLTALDVDINEGISWAEDLTQSNTALQLNLMVNYGSKMELVKAAKQLQDSNQPISEEALSGALFTAGIPDPDILIRTGGDHRLSNFLLWQAAYSELFFLDMLWPDFTQDTLKNVIDAFHKRERRFGGLNG